MKKLPTNQYQYSLTMSSSSSSSPSSESLSALAVFRNILNQELIRSVHAYRDNGGGEGSWTEREFMLLPDDCIEIGADPVIVIGRQPRGRFQEGERIGFWLCMFVFDSADVVSSSLSIPSMLCLSRNPQLKSIPNLANDLRKVYLLMSRTYKDEPLNFGNEETRKEKEEESSTSSGNDSSFLEDQQVVTNQPNDRFLPELGSSAKKRRAPTDRVANISLSDLAKHFNLPMTEASRNLKIGLTVLKRKCREFGIPRWPHRKIKSLDTLIQNIQEEVGRQEKDNEAAAVKAATKRQQMLEMEKEGIKNSPIKELQKETKRFRQDVFKRRHKAKAQSKMPQ
ncbi:protein RKD5 isoform X2 [Asparagus officinalis]|uniref:protein RKD5 isoform X2 n=1 Tax=Asparagus officinalis TaxID=4686 RepID=UPI00098E2F26|nr:protein RKD5 isoform X2 [Asparagus officinalis]